MEDFEKGNSITKRINRFINWWNDFDILWFKGRPYIVRFSMYASYDPINSDPTQVFPIIIYYTAKIKAFDYCRTWVQGTRTYILSRVAKELAEDFKDLKWYKFFYWPVDVNGKQLKRNN
jgi:hypothetical protein